MDKEFDKLFKDIQFPTDEELKRDTKREKQSKIIKQKFDHDQTYKENHNKGMVKRSNNGTWRKNKKESNQKLKEDPDWLAKVNAGIRKKEEDLEFTNARNERNKHWPNDPDWRKNQKEGAQRACKEEKWLESHTGENHYNFKGVTVGTDILTGEVKYRFVGSNQIQAMKFSAGAISQCINGKKNKYKGCVWSRESLNDYEDPEWCQKNKEKVLNLVNHPSWGKPKIVPKAQNSAKFKGTCIGTDIITGKIKYKLSGSSEIRAAGLYPSGVNGCIRGELKSYKGCVWHREPVKK